MRVMVLVFLAVCGVAMAEHSMKGWELHHAKGPVFGLLVGTNRQKTDAEIRGSLNISGWGELEKALGKLAAGDALIVQGDLGAADRKRLAQLCAKYKLALQ